MPLTDSSELTRTAEVYTTGTSLKRYHRDGSHVARFHDTGIEERRAQNHLEIPSNDLTGEERPEMAIAQSHANGSTQPLHVRRLGFAHLNGSSGMADQHLKPTMS